MRSLAALRAGVLLAAGLAAAGCGARRPAPAPPAAPAGEAGAARPEAPQGPAARPAPRGAARAALPQEPPRSPAAALVGAGSCTSSGCHAAPIADHAPWQSAYTVWATRDPHAGAHEILGGALAARIVAALERRDPSRPQPPARENMACVGCHATGRGPTAGEGVSCESCHGPAGGWLVAHTARGWRTAGNDLGMVDLADPATCAVTCAGCHVGGEATGDGAIREVTHDLVAAGHPRLAFELRGFKRGEPPHWRDRAAASAEHAAGPVEEWAGGRLGALERYLRQVDAQAETAAGGERGLTAGVWPELTAFDCHGCHRPALLGAPAAPAVARRDGTPGSPRLEPMLWSHLDLILPPASAAALEALRGAVERGWSRVPDRRLLAAAIEGVEAARGGLADHVAMIPAAALAEGIAAATDATSWAEAVSAYGGLEAIAAREAAAGRIAADDPVFGRLAALRRLLEFPVERVDGGVERFSSPRRYAAGEVGAAIRAIAAALAAPAPAPAR